MNVIFLNSDSKLFPLIAVNTAKHNFFLSGLLTVCVAYLWPTTTLLTTYHSCINYMYICVYLCVTTIMIIIITTIVQPSSSMLIYNYVIYFSRMNDDGPECDL